MRIDTTRWMELFFGLPLWGQIALMIGLLVFLVVVGIIDADWSYKSRHGGITEKDMKPLELDRDSEDSDS